MEISVAKYVLYGFVFQQPPGNGHEFIGNKSRHFVAAVQYGIYTAVIKHVVEHCHFHSVDFPGRVAWCEPLPEVTQYFL